MLLARSKVTSQGQVSIPVEVRKRLGIVPGSTLEWDEQDGQITLRRSGTFSSEEIHRVLFPDGTPVARTDEDLREGIKQYVRERYARR